MVDGRWSGYAFGMPTATATTTPAATAAAASTLPTVAVCATVSTNYVCDALWN